MFHGDKYVVYALHNNACGENLVNLAYHMKSAQNSNDGAHNLGIWCFAKRIRSGSTRLSARLVCQHEIGWYAASGYVYGFSGKDKNL